MSVTRYTARSGYVLLISVLVVGVVASASAITILMLGLGAEKSALAVQQSTQSYANAWSCAEHAIQKLREDFEYEGNESKTLTYAFTTNTLGYPGHIDYGSTSCIIYPVGGYGNEDRTICIEGTFGKGTKRRLEVAVTRIHPDVRIGSWEEVGQITSCSMHSV